MPAAKNKIPDHWADGLTQRQIDFVTAYLSPERLGNATQSAIAAGYKSDNGWQILNQPAVQRAIATRVSQRLAGCDGDAIKSALAMLARSDMSNFVSVDGEGKLTLDWVKARDAAALGQIKQVTIKPTGEVTIKIHDPRPALEILAKIMGMLKERVEHSGEVKFNPITLDGDKDLDAARFTN